MQRDFDPGEPADVTDRRFDAVVVALAAEDPRFARRTSTPRTARLPAGALAIVVGLLVTLAAGVVPLAIGLHLHSDALLTVGAIGLIVLPVAVPLAVRGVVRRIRPLWR